MSVKQALEVASWERCEIPASQTEIHAAKAAVDKEPNNGQLWMQYGHALAAQSFMREAADAYSMAVSCDPFNWEYYRHRAHRFLSCWRFEDAAADFTIADRLNPKEWNVLYHLGLSWFLLGDYEKAVEAYARCYAMSEKEMDIIAISDWYWMALKRLGRDDDAAKLLERIHEGMDADENVAYYNRLLMYKGLRKPEELLTEDATALDIITQGFGVANYYELMGERQKSDEVIERVLKAGDENDLYFAFAYLAAKVDKRNRAK